MLGLVRRTALVVALALLPVCSGGAEEEKAAPPDLSGLDLSGDWYVLVHYRNEDTENPTLVRFKDFAWTIEQTANTLTWEVYPYVIFDDDLELVRRHAMTQHLPWEPDANVWQQIRTAIGVSSRAMQRKRLTGSVAEGYASLPPLGSGGFNVMTFTRNWQVRFAKSSVRVEIVDALSGGAGLSGMEETTLYEIRTRAAPDELRGVYREGSKQGEFRMVRSAERRVDP